MPAVQRVGEEFVVEATLIAAAFGVAPDRVQGLMRQGAITSRCEEGEGEDAGRWRLTFLHADRALRLIVDGNGAVLKRATFPVRPRPSDAIPAERPAKPERGGPAD